MRKKLTVILCAVLMITAEGVFGAETTAEPKETSKTEAAGSEASSGSEAEAETEEETEALTENVSESGTEEEPEVVLYNQDGYRIACTGFDAENRNNMGPSLELKIENSTEHNVNFMDSGSYVNGSMIVLSAYLGVPAGKTLSEKVYFPEEELKSFGITSIEDITLNFRIYDLDSYTLLGKVGPVSVTITEDGEVRGHVVYTDSETIRKVQTLLNEKGYDCGSVDGIAGEKTEDQILKYEKDHHLKETADITDELLESLSEKE